MEDRHVVMPSLLGAPGASLYAVFDGHAGAKAADFCQKHVGAALTSDGAWPTRPVQALTAAFEGLDAEFLAIAGAATPPLDDGTTALAALHIGGMLYVANAGDSRALLLQADGRWEALSEDHKPNRPDETARIKAAGGTVYFHGVWRVGGLLAVSRAIGDRTLKPVVTARPDVAAWSVQRPRDSALLLATDGLWDVYSNAEVAAIVRATSRGGRVDAARAAAALVSGAIARGSSDNVTCLIVDLALGGEAGPGAILVEGEPTGGRAVSPLPSRAALGGVATPFPTPRREAGARRRAGVGEDREDAGGPQQDGGGLSVADLQPILTPPPPPVSRRERAF
jgi:protein phosphatase 1L